MARRRYQRGSLSLRGKREPVWVGRRWEDIVDAEGHVVRIRPARILGTQKELPTRKLALRELERWVAEVNSPVYRPRALTRFGDYARGWIENGVRHLKPSTVLNYRSHLNRYLLPFFGPLDMRSIHPEMVERFLGKLEGSARTRRNVAMTLRSLWTKARRQGVVDHNAFAGVDLPQGGEVEHDYLSLEEIHQVIAAASEPDRTLYWLVAETGFRAGELTALRIDDVDTTVGVVSVRRSHWRGQVLEPKTKQGRRRAAISPNLAAHLEHYMRHVLRPNPEGYLFPTDNNTPVNGNDKLDDLHKLLARLGLKHCGFHAFRHGSATEMDRRNVPLSVRQARLGHKDVRLTLRTYTHPVVEDERRFIAEVGRILDPTRDSGLKLDSSPLGADGESELNQ